MVDLSSLGGVPNKKQKSTQRFPNPPLPIDLPVFNLPILKFNFSNVFARPILGSSPILPAGFVSKPMLICPFRKVPVVITTVLLDT